MKTQNAQLEDTYKASVIFADASEEQAAFREEVDRLQETVSEMYVDLINRWIIRTASVLKGEN